jgi:5'-nucleotidase
MLEPEARRSDWINTYLGHKIYPLDPDPTAIDILDVAHALSIFPRFCGHTRCFYSVAEHSVYVSQYCPREFALWGLLHDASEAYLGDITRPLKRTETMAPYRDSEKRLMSVICERFGISKQEPAEVKEADQRLLYTEAIQLFPRRNADWRQHAEPYPGLIIRGLNPEAAESLFLRRYVELTGASGVTQRLEVCRRGDFEHRKQFLSEG